MPFYDALQVSSFKMVVWLCLQLENWMNYELLENASPVYLQILPPHDMGPETFNKISVIV